MRYFKDKFIYYIFVTIFLIFTLGPILWTFILSITPEKLILNSHINYFNINFSLENYINLLNINKIQGTNFYNSLLNSLIVSFITIFFGLPLCFFAGYSFSRLKFRLKNALYAIILSTIIIPIFATIIPLYTIFSTLGILDNNFWLSMVYISSFFPLITWIITNYFKTFPLSIEEMALIDGCSRVQVLIYIILPSTYPIILSSILIIFLMSWNQYQIPLILTLSMDTKPLTILIAEFSSKDSIFYSQIAAAGILSIIPPCIFAILFRKYLVDSLINGSTKD